MRARKLPYHLDPRCIKNPNLALVDFTQLLAKEGKLKGRSIRTYVLSLFSWFQLMDPAILNLDVAHKELDRVSNSYVPAVNHAKKARQDTTPFSPEVLHEICSDESIPHHVRAGFAISLAGGHRPINYFDDGRAASKDTPLRFADISIAYPGRPCAPDDRHYNLRARRTKNNKAGLAPLVLIPPSVVGAHNPTKWINWLLGPGAAIPTGEEGQREVFPKDTRQGMQAVMKRLNERDGTNYNMYSTRKGCATSLMGHEKIKGEMIEQRADWHGAKNHAALHLSG